MAEVLVLTTALPKHADDYAGRFVLDWADAMSAAGHSLRFVAPEGSVCRDPLTSFRRGSVLRGSGAPERLASRPLRSTVSGVRTTGALVRAANTAHRPSDVVVAHWLLPAGLVACRLGQPLIYAHGGDVALLERLPVGRVLARLLDRRAHTLAFVATGLRTRFNALLGRAPRAQQAIAPMGVPQAAAVNSDEVTRFRQAAQGRRIVATVGRLVPIKGYDALPAALAGLDVVWIAAGDGPEQARLARLAQAHKVNVRWLGAVGPGTRDALLAAASVFVQPSRALGARTEGRPVSVMEALVAGLPVIARRGGPVADMLPEPRLTFANTEELKTALRAALDEPRTAAHLHAGSQYQWAQQGAAHSALIAGLPSG